MTKIILITGATGSIGKKLRKHFASLDGFELRLLCLNPPFPVISHQGSSAKQNKDGGRSPVSAFPVDFR